MGIAVPLPIPDPLPTPSPSPRQPPFYSVARGRPIPRHPEETLQSDSIVQPPPKAAVLIEVLAELDVTHVVGLPDNSSAALFAGLADHETITLLTVTREGEAFAIASGLWAGGGVPVVVVQNTGLLESGDSLRGTAVRMGVPLVCLVTYRGYETLRQQGVKSSKRRPTRELLVRPDIDSAGLVTEQTLNAWGIPFNFYETDGHRTRVKDGWFLARGEERPVALLLTQALK